ncbi:MAG: 5'-nucleotidase C-terminal domain-containing protein [Bacteroidia bacterium]
MPNKVFTPIIHLFTLLLLYSCSPKVYTYAPQNLENKEISEVMLEDSLIESIIKPYRQPLEKSMSEVLIRCESEATKGLPESSLGNLVADLLLNGSRRISQQKIDLAFLNTGGLRVEWPKGNITRSMVFELMPFENTAEIASFTGYNLKLLLNQVAQRGGCPMAGISFGIKDNKAVNIKIGGLDIQDDQIYLMASTDYLLNNGDKYTIPEYSSRTALGIKFRDLLLDEIGYLNKNAMTLKPSKDGRIYLSNTP